MRFVSLSRLAPAVLVALLGLTAGCIDLGEPEIEDRWTRIDLEGTNVLPGQTLATGSSDSIAVSVAITYRRIVTGFAVAELRGSSTLSAADVAVYPDGDRLRMATDIDRILQNSVTLGRATRAVTGWDHLIQRIDFSFRGFVPATLDSGSVRGLFLLCYMGSGDEIELQDGRDSIVVTPFLSSQAQLLPVGMELAVSPGPN
jgi:hypothetical protein